MESCFAYLYRRPGKSNALWKESLWLRNLPIDTPIFNNILLNQDSGNDISLFREYDRQALLYMRTLYGPRHVLTLRATAIALSVVNIRQHFLEIYKPFSKILHSLNCQEFLQIHPHIRHLFREYISNFSKQPSSLDGFFKILNEFTLIFRAKHQQHMSPSTRNFYAAKFEQFLYYLIEIMQFLIKKYKDGILVISEEIEHFIKIHFKNSPSTSLARMCLERNNIRMFELFLFCGDDINKTDKNNETILHYLLDSKIFCKRRLIKLVVDAGFDFSRVTSIKYCLPCRMKKEGFLFDPEECKTLQCLAATVICQKTVFRGTDIPPILRTIIKTHMHIPYRRHLWITRLGPVDISFES